MFIYKFLLKKNDLNLFIHFYFIEGYFCLELIRYIEFRFIKIVNK
jgi:hypothetical protein